MKIRLRTPLTDHDVLRLRAGELVFLTGTLYTARDVAHRRLVELLEAGKSLPFDPKGQVLYYAGPSPAPPGRPIGAVGPTTSGRMDPYTPRLLEAGIKGTVGKGKRSEEVKEALRLHKAVYLGATGGAGALLSRYVKKAEVIAFSELGPEAVMALEVEDFPAIVINDAFGGDLYLEGPKPYQVKP